MRNKKCPRCSGKLYVDPGYKDEAYCIACGYVEYRETLKECLPNPFGISFEKQEVYTR
jgi:ribosomal protein S27AE